MHIHKSEVNQYVVHFPGIGWRYKMGWYLSYTTSEWDGSNIKEDMCTLPWNGKAEIKAIFAQYIVVIRWKGAKTTSYPGMGRHYKMG